MTPHKTLNKYSISTLADFTKLSKSYISQVKHGKCPASKKLTNALIEFEKSKEDRKADKTDYQALFLKSRKVAGVTPSSYRFYFQKVSRFFNDLNPNTASESQLESFLMQFSNLGNRARYFQVIKTYYRWLELVFNIPSPIRTLKAPKIPNLILPSLSSEQVQLLIEKAGCLRDKAIIALFVESGLRLSELANIQLKNIDWQSHTIQVLGKGRKEALSPFGSLSESLLKQWIAEFKPKDKLWNINKWGITIMLRRLEKETGIKANPHTFRRTFACLLRKAGVDTMTIKDLGRWESLTMVQRYTRSFTFADSLRFYKAPLG